MKFENTPYGQSLSIFPTTLFVTQFVTTDEFKDFLLGLPVNKRFEKNEKKEDQVQKLYGFHTEDLYILRNKECEDLRKHILNTALHYVNDILGYKCTGLADTLSWLSIKAPGDKHIPHTHPNSFISGVYYYEDVATDTPLVFLKNRNTHNSFEFIPPFDREKAEKNPTSMEHVTVLPAKGDIIMFPSYLQHFVPENTSNVNRGALAFNLMPVTNVGDEQHLTMFKYADTLPQY